MGARDRKRQKRIRDYVIERDGSLCCYCDKVLVETTITLDHIVPDSKNGTFNATNLTVACGSCNSRRGNKLFFDYCRQFNWSQDKLEKYRLLYRNNLRIKVLNIAKEQCIKNDCVVPSVLLKQACQLLKIKAIDFSEYERLYCFDIRFNEACDRKRIKYCFEELIRLIEADSK